jgi:hypothetical protein
MPSLDLDAFGPEPNSIVFRGIEYAIPGTIPLTMIIEAAQYEERLRAAEKDIRETLASGDTEQIKKRGAEQQGILESMYALCMKLLRLENPDVPELDLTAEQCGSMLALMSSGGLDVDIDRAVLEAIAGPEDERRPPASSKTRKSPTSRSGKPSRARSSR